MGFSNQERINANTKALQANVIDANSIAQWYESRNQFAFLLNGNKILTQLSSVPSASSLSAARTNASNNPTIISDLSQTGSAIRLTAVAGTNSTTYIAYSTYNDASSAVLDNWIQPQLISQSNGAPSIGYSIILYDGDPATTGVEVTTTDGTTGTGQTKTVGWIWNYATGILLLAEDFKSSVSDPYVLGFRYIGTNANDAAAGTTVTFTADETISAGDLIRFVTSSDSGLTAGRVIKSSATTENDADCIGVAKTGGNQGDTITASTTGNASISFSSPPSSSSNGSTVFLSTTSGLASLVAPSGSGETVVRIGKLFGADGSSSAPNCTLNIETIITLG